MQRKIRIGFRKLSVFVFPCFALGPLHLKSLTGVERFPYHKIHFEVISGTPEELLVVWV